jgi:hypothetical protein
MPISPSTRKYWTEANRIKDYPLSEKLHGYFYLRFPFFNIATATASNRLGKFGAKLITLINRLFPSKPAKSNQITFADTYNGKVIPLQTAKTLVISKQNIKVDDLEKVFLYQLARSPILDHPESLVALDCPCRVVRLITFIFRGLIIRWRLWRFSFDIKYTLFPFQQVDFIL